MATENVQGSGGRITLANLNQEQISLLLTQIATSADTLSTFAAYAAQRADGGAMWDLHVVESLAERIGALAELAVPGAVRGTFAGWSVCSDFETMGLPVGGAVGGGHD
ncbi:hypothetical protein [Variovorax paradoxus]|uniref:Peptidase M48 Ste24p n=1 Tax=Variovorax paradoxus (strain EPS) TaxID=595537 RepID=E6V3Q8_VARPE|nr:hypothetical protein [Variovorax paradoxus]ADU36932.1 peptidase M48 Ste24p [Variovorax paradoxus EPS]